MFDIHCHILPGIDDGADILDDTIKMAALAVKGRCSGIVCTPHQRPGSDYEIKMLPFVTKKLQELLLRHGIRLSLFAGQEIFLDDDSAERLIAGEYLTLNGSAYPLVEFDFEGEGREPMKLLEKLVTKGFIPVVAHPERYDFVASDIRAAEYIRSMGCVLQLNKGSFKGAFGNAAYKCARKMMDEGLADVVASDAHGPYMRTPYLADIHEYLSTEWSGDYADLLLRENPFRIIKNLRVKRRGQI